MKEITVRSMLDYINSRPCCCSLLLFLLVFCFLLVLLMLLSYLLFPLFNALFTLASLVFNSFILCYTCKSECISVYVYLHAVVVPYENWPGHEDF